MRTSISFTALLAVSLTVSSMCAYASSEKTPDEQSIAELEAKATVAQPREQCFLYAELVHQMTELSLRQYAAGDFVHAEGLLKRIQTFASKIHLSLGRNDKRLKSAEILLNNTSFRLKEMLQASDYQDRPLVQQTLAKVNDAQDEAMLQVFQQ